MPTFVLSEECDLCGAFFFDEEFRSPTALPCAFPLLLFQIIANNGNFLLDFAAEFHCALMLRNVL